MIAGPRYFGLVRSKEGAVDVIEKGAGPYYGISWSGEELFVLARNRGQGDEIHVYDESLSLVRCVELGRPIDGHQILYHAGVLYVTATAENAVICLDPKTGVQEQWNWTGYSNDVNHINALGLESAGRLWVSHDNKKGNVSEVVLLSPGSEEALRSQPVGEPSAGTHNIERGIVVASGRNSSIWHFEGTELFQVGEISGGFCRGLGFTRLANERELMLVGVSEVMERMHRNAPNDAEVRIFDLRTFSEVSRLVIPTIGQVYDLRTLDLDTAHNGIRCPVGESLRPFEDRLQVHIQDPPRKTE